MLKFPSKKGHFASRSDQADKFPLEAQIFLKNALISLKNAHFAVLKWTNFFKKLKYSSNVLGFPSQMLILPQEEKNSLEKLEYSSKILILPCSSGKIPQKCSDFPQKCSFCLKKRQIALKSSNIPQKCSNFPQKCSFLP
jgi:hypothetical protein